MKQQESGMNVDINLRLIDVHEAIRYLQTFLNQALTLAIITGQTDVISDMNAGRVALAIVHRNIDKQLCNEDALQIVKQNTIKLTAEGRAVMDEGGHADD